MSRFADKYRIESTRLKNWDYSTPGIYFITICTHLHNNFFGKIFDNQMIYSKSGQIAHDCLNDIPKHFSNINISESVVMPNHIHLLVNLSSPRLNFVETHDRASLPIRYQSYHYHRLAVKSNQTIPKIISQYKSTVTRLINPKTIFFAWQSGFYDEIITDDKRLLIIRKYIQTNIVNWQKDKLYSLN